jgi:dethiobiotin synthetase
MMKAYFITGTDTDVGKTVIASSLLQYFNRKGLLTSGFKPLAAGCQHTSDGLQNEDALSLQRNSTVALSYAEVNPYAFAPAIAPHIAASKVGQHVTVQAIADAYVKIKHSGCDVAIVEGAGGWCLPLNDQEFLYQWVAQEKLDVILVVGIKLGCLNHALLTQAFIQSQGLNIAGWVANIIDADTQFINENIMTLQRQLFAPLLATVPYVASEALDQLQIDFEFTA